MATELKSPPVPRSQMYNGKIMAIEWQNFFRQLFERVGGYEALSIGEITDLIESLSVLDPLRIVATDSDGEVISVTSLKDWVKGDQIDDGVDGTVTFNISDITFESYFYGRNY